MDDENQDIRRITAIEVKFLTARNEWTHWDHIPSPAINIDTRYLNYQISREKFEPEPGFKPQTSGFLARRSTTWAILVLMPVHVQISLLRWMPL